MRIAEVLRLLVVEDHPFQRSMLLRMLRSLGASNPLEASDGAQALEIIAANSNLDVVICDLKIPGMDGLEFIRHLGITRPDLSVIVASAEGRAILNSVEKMTRAHGGRLLGVIEKPVTPEPLEALLAQHKAHLPLAGVVGPKYSLEEILAGIRDRQFEPYFQAKINFATGSVVGAKALARWCSPQHGIVGPYAFIPVLEEHRHIDELTFLMLERAAACCLGWRASGLDLSVSVNLSLLSLTDTSLAERLTRIVNATGLDPQHVVLEITETAAMTEVAPALENLAQLRMKGFGLAADDYGTGFSSLSQLTRVPFTELKIDQSFVRDCTSDETRLAIVDSSVDLAQRLGMVSVAEGVETREDWDALQRAGCVFAQGYYIAKPLKNSVFEAFCHDWIMTSRKSKQQAPVTRANYGAASPTLELE